MTNTESLRHSTYDICDRRAAKVSVRSKSSCRLARLTLITFTMILAQLGLRAQVAADAQSKSASMKGTFTVRAQGGKLTLIDPAGHPFYSLGINHVDMDGYYDRKGVNLYKDSVTAKYGTLQNWAAAQRKRFDGWGINTIAAFSNVDPFVGSNIAYTVYINTLESDTDLWNPAWEQTANDAISRATTLHRNDRNLLGYFTDNEISWTVDLAGIVRPHGELFVIGRYFHSPYGRAKLVAFLKQHYATVDALRADFPASTIVGKDWDTLDLGASALGPRATPHGQDTIDAWAEVLAHRYFEVTAGALRRGDSTHLNLGTKFIANLTPIKVLKVAAAFSDVISTDYYDTGSLLEDMKDSSSSNPFAFLLSELPMDKLVSTRNMLADWYRISEKPILIAEFGYRAADAGLPNTIPPSIVVVPNQHARARAVTNYVNCALNEPYIVGVHYFELFDEPVAGRGDGENSNWGLVSGKDEPYPEITSALAIEGNLAGHRLEPGVNPLPCTPIGKAHF
jgi:agarase